VVPLLADREFGVGSRTAVLAFIASFGAAKALTNVAGGWAADRWGRKRVLIAGWIVGVPVPLLVIWAPAWSWVVLANVLLGVQQGLCWSTTVIMKIDLVGPQRRGLAMGLNEFAGYLAVAVAAYSAGVVAERFGLRPEPFYLGVAFVVLGLALSVLFVRESAPHAAREAARLGPATGGAAAPGFAAVLRRVSYADPALVSCSQAGLVNNLNDGVAWGLLPLLFASAGLSVQQIGALAALYPATWGLCQLGTGALSDRWGRKWMIAGGMGVQGIGLLGMAVGRSVSAWAAAAVLLGVGTALVYPTLLAAISDVAHPVWRGTAVGVYRLWRDAGYVVGALLGGLLADLFSLGVAIAAAGLLTVGSGMWVAVRMPETLGSGYH